MPAGVGEFGMDCVPLGYFGVDETLGGLRTSGIFWAQAFYGMSKFSEIVRKF